MSDQHKRNRVGVVLSSEENEIWTAKEIKEGRDNARPKKLYVKWTPKKECEKYKAQKAMHEVIL